MPRKRICNVPTNTAVQHVPVYQWFFVTLENGNSGGKHVATV